jgi:hypothetical protein
VPCVCVCCLWRSRWSPNDIWHRRSLGDPSHVGGVVIVVGNENNGATGDFYTVLSRQSSFIVSVTLLKGRLFCN